MKWVYLLVGVVAGALAHIAYSAGFPSPALRTDLQIYQDAETGCEYLKPAWGFGGLTPRNDSLGVPICRDEKIDENVEKLLDDVGNDPDKPVSQPPATGPEPAPATAPAPAPAPVPAAP